MPQSYNVDGLLALWERVPTFRSLVDAVRKRQRAVSAEGLPGSSSAFAAAALVRSLGRPILWVAPHQGAAEAAAASLQAWLGPGSRIGVLPATEVLPFEALAASREADHAYLSTLGEAARGALDVLVAPLPALMRRVLPLSLLADLYDTASAGDVREPGDLARRLIRLGYERVEQVETPGRFALRGGLMDVFPPGARTPYRLEFFGDEVDSIRTFDPATQRTIEEVPSFLFGPSAPLVLDDDARRRVLAAIDGELEGNGKVPPELAEQVAAHRESFAEGLPFPAMERYLTYAYPEARSPVGVFGSSGLVIVDDPARVYKAMDDFEKYHGEQAADLIMAGHLLPGQTDYYLTAEQFQGELHRCQRLYLMGLPQSIPGVAPETMVTFRAREAPSFQGQWPIMLEEVEAWRAQMQRVVVAVDDDDSAIRLRNTLEEGGITALVETGGISRPPRPGVVTVAAIPPPEGHRPGRGFIAGDAGLVWLTTYDLRGRPGPRHRRPSAAWTPGTAIRHHHQLDEGDYVVHVHQGIGRYLGVKTMEVAGTRRDYLAIQYAGTDRLYVPVEQIDLIQKYAGAEGREPRLYRLGGSDWTRVKQQVKQSVREMAEELLALYAAREQVQGHAFGPDEPWQIDFEQSFPYEETPDQLRATAEIKADMERVRPMDRLLCGDVGFGKTEVAFRAAFKAVSQGKQVAFLVPTTVLAQQHYKTAVERFEAFPVTIDSLSRLRSPGEQLKVIDGLRRGSIDFIVGTHRLLQADVAFKDLGLLIVDEEHRFGVADKERIKQLRQNVDVLTLTATPIPRTLHMAMTGLRDTSLIETPPAERRPVQTYVLEYSDFIVRDALRRELSRGGQVFYVHNRVKTINAAARRLRELVPDARIATAHGQMNEHRLEEVMLAFIAGEYDVLIATTIIESGLDIPNVNTLIIEDADRMGLAQLYQLRGRVGRSHRLAYAYFTYRKNKVLTEVAVRRLQAIKDFTELGSGYKLALRDLEIRGAGNILGPEQHGFIVSVGFELYTQLLQEAVEELKGTRGAPKLKPTIDLRWDAYLPDDYVGESRRKVEFYKRIEEAESREELAALRDELTDRYGDPPVAARNLFTLAEVRRRAAEAGILAISQSGRRLKFELAPFPREALKARGLGERRRGRSLSFEGGRPAVTVFLKDEKRRSVLGAIQEVLALMAPVVGGAALPSHETSSFRA